MALSCVAFLLFLVSFGISSAVSVGLRRGDDHALHAKGRVGVTCTAMCWGLCTVPHYHTRAL